MRHKRNTQNLSRFSSYFKATIHALAKSVLERQKIVTTKVRAKLTRRLVERLVTLGKEADSLAARRRAFAILQDHALVKKLFSDIGPRFTERKGGYTRIIPYKKRRGDNADMVVLELSVLKEVPRAAVKPEKKTQEAKPKTASAAPKPEHKDIAPPEKEKHRKETKKPSPKILGGFEKFFKQKRDSGS